MELEVGMYVRTKDGLVSKIQGINEYSIALKNTYCERLKDKYFTFPNEEKIYEIAKVSHNIIDLIEVGDYVNGYKVDYVNLGDEDYNTWFSLENMGSNSMQGNEDIKEILTKEQYKSNIYRVEE